MIRISLGRGKYEGIVFFGGGERVSFREECGLTGVIEILKRVRKKGGIVELQSVNLRKAPYTSIL